VCNLFGSPKEVLMKFVSSRIKSEVGVAWRVVAEAAAAAVAGTARDQINHGVSIIDRPRLRSPPT
jgi:hypothetical protein